MPDYLNKILNVCFPIFVGWTPYSPVFIEEVWERCITNSSAYKQPRIAYLLDAFSFEGQRLKFDTAFESKEEQVIYAICEYVKNNNRQ